jgi:predicted DsbA family dithiol-disulfide isomerase/uncharacterized membrane protein
VKFLAFWKPQALLAAILILCGVGAYVSNGLLGLHDGAPPASTVALRLISHLCTSTADESSGCQASAQSVWSEIRLPIPVYPIQIPVAFLAIAYFTALGVWYAFVGEALPAWRPLRWLPVLLAMAGAYASLFFMCLMVLGRAPWCGGCVTVHAINFLLVLCIGLSRRSAPPADNTGGTIGIRQCVSAIVFAITLITLLSSARTRRLAGRDQLADLQWYRPIVESLQNNPKLLVDAYLDEPVQDIPLRADEQNSAATHRLVVFLDFQCPSCMMTESFIRNELRDDFGDKLNVVMRHYPLCKTCNPKIPKTIHPAACTAAYAAEAARLVGGRAGFDRMSEVLFANQMSLNDGENRDLAIEAGIDADQFLKAMNDPAVAQRVTADIDEAHALHVTNTPTMFLDGRRVPEICMASAFWKAIAKAPAPSGPG